MLKEKEKRIVRKKRNKQLRQRQGGPRRGGVLGRHRQMTSTNRKSRDYCHKNYLWLRIVHVSTPQSPAPRFLTLKIDEN